METFVLALFVTRCIRIDFFGNYRVEIFRMAS
jgi:hypothetical protein